MSKCTRKMFTTDKDYDVSSACLFALVDKWIGEADKLYSLSASGPVIARAAMKGAAIRILSMAEQLRTVVLENRNKEG